MRLDTTIKLSDVIKVVLICVSVVIFVQTNRNLIMNLSEKQQSDHEIITALSKGFSELATREAVTETRLDNQERERDRAYHETAPEMRGAGKLMKDN